MKKILVVFLALLLLGGVLASCGTTTTSSGGLKKGTIEVKSSSGSSGSALQTISSDERKLLDDLYQQKLAGTQAFAEVQKHGTVYYISSINGNDSNSGTSPSQSWKTMSNMSKVSAGDTVLFERGSVFRRTKNETFFSSKNGVTYATYGTGAKPIFYGSLTVTADKWKAVEGRQNLYYFEDKTLNLTLSNDIGSIIFNEGEAWGIKIQMTYNDPKTKQDPANMTLGLEGVNNGLATYDIPSYAMSNGTGLQGPDLCFYQDYSSKRVYLYCEGGNPGKRFTSVELSFGKYAFSFDGGVSDITIQNLEFRNFGNHVIRTLDCKNLTVQNCAFYFVGGTIQLDYGEWRNVYTRLGNAVENWNSCNGMTVENCYFDQVYDTAMTTQSNSNVTSTGVVYRNNVVQNVWFGVELWAGNGNQTLEFSNVDVSGNYFKNIGEGLCSQRPDKVEDGYSINAFLKFSRSPYTVSDFSVTNNTIDGTNGKMLYTTQTKTTANSNGAFFDSNTYVGTSDVDFAVVNGKKYAFTESGIAAVQKLGVEVNGKFYLQETMSSLREYNYKAANGVNLPFRLIFPEGYTQAQGYPLVTYLNTENASGTDNQLNLSVTGNVIQALADKQQAILLIPQCPSGTWTGLPVSNGNYSTSGVKETATMKAVAALIRDVADEYKITKKYAIGVDAGAYAVSDLLARHNGLLRAGIIIAGAGDPNASIGSAKAWVIHSEHDDVIPCKDAQALADAWNAELKLFSWGQLHDCWDEAVRTEDLLGWLIKQ